ncbi:MAG: sodium-dependent transporter [Prevotella sp.]|nr:sodium-dependent transporter [Prevotella sp.]
MEQNRGTFGGQTAGVLVIAGSAIGLGNIWRFPYELGRNGGAVYLIIYVLCIALFGLPLMVSEFAVGRNAQSNTARAFGAMGGGKAWKWVGFLGMAAGTLILCYYGVVAGWTLEYLIRAGVGGFAEKGTADFTADFSAFISDPVRPVACMALFMLINLGVILAGVEKGIERVSKILMPLLFLFVVALAAACLTLPGAADGMTFLFKPDLSKFTPSSVFSAMGQCFFSLSLCMGCICTYASYFRKEDKLVRSATNAVAIDTIIAVLAGVIIFSTAFSVGIEPDAGPSLLFITLPNVFQRVFAGQTLLCYVFSLMFYVLLFIATLTSAMGLLEVPTIYLKEEYRIRRRYSSVISTVFCIIVGVACSLSMGLWAGFTVGGMNLFDLFDFVTAKVMLPVGGFLTALYTGWFCDRRLLYKQVTSDGRTARAFFPVYRFLLRYIVPVAILVIFLNQLGLF